MKIRKPICRHCESEEENGSCRRGCFPTATSCRGFIYHPEQDERNRAEIASLAAAVETSGVVCPVCRGEKEVEDPDKSCVFCKGGKCQACNWTGERVQMKGYPDMMPCPHCSVPAGAWVECETCNGRGSVAADNPADHAMFDPDGTDYAVYARAGGRTPCPDCNGRGKIRTPVALGRVWDEEE